MPTEDLGPLSIPSRLKLYGHTDQTYFWVFFIIFVFKFLNLL